MARARADAGERTAHQRFQRGDEARAVQRGMKELAPTIWITALRKVQNPNRAGLDIVVARRNFNTIKVSPVFYWSDAEMEAYLAAAQPAERVGLLRSREGRREARVRFARRVGRQSVAANASEISEGLPMSSYDFLPSRQYSRNRSHSHHA
jgi:hypothetical protein